jgi:predicted Zn-dependent peptidase
MELKYHKFKLPNGIRVIMVPKKETKVVKLEIIFGVGSRYETKEIGGIAHFLEHMAFKGTKNRPTMLDITREIDQVGGSWNAYTDEDRTGYYIALRSEKIELAFNILSDMLLNSKYDKKEIDKEKGVILEEIKMYNDEPFSYARLNFQKLVYGNTPLGRDALGEIETVKAINRKKILDFKADFYSPNNMVIAVGGNINQTEIKKLVKKYFGKLKGKTCKTFERNNIIQRDPMIKIYKRDIEQSNLIMGFRSFGRGGKDEYTRNILTKILGGYMSSKLFIEVREKRGLAYDVRSWVEAYTETGCFGVLGGLNPHKPPEALKEIFKIFRQTKNKGFTPAEIKMAKENSIGRLVMSLEGAGGWSTSIAEDELFGLPVETPDEIIKRINKVTNSDIKRLAREIFRPENFNMVIVGPTDPKQEKKYLDLIKL